jgi:DNA-binding response OmpR family regulator
MHIVHLEDESPMREILRVALMAASPGVNLQQFASSDAAMEYAEQHLNDVDLFILDIRVPGKMNGLEFGKALRDQHSDSIIAITSAYRAPSKAELESYKLEWLAKPWHLMDVLDKLLPMIRARQSTRNQN